MNSCAGILRFITVETTTGAGVSLDVRVLASVLETATQCGHCVCSDVVYIYGCYIIWVYDALTGLGHKQLASL